MAVYNNVADLYDIYLQLYIECVCGIELEKIYFGVKTKAEVLGAAFVCFIFRKWVYTCEHLNS